MLRMAMNVTWRNRVSNDVLYDDLPKVTVKIKRKETASGRTLYKA